VWLVALRPRGVEDHALAENKAEGRPRSESELDAQGALDHTRSAADHACGGPDCGGRSAAHGCGDFAEVSVALARRRIGEVGVVEEIEEVRPEAQVDSFRM